MRKLPAGVVTFLFTDVEGSTRLLDELGAERYGEALAEHRRRLREAFESHGGVEVDTQGDAFFVAFPDAGEALTAAAEAQEALSAGRISVRMALHSGEPVVTEEGYVGMDVHRAARICSTAHGGQVVLSARTRQLIDGDSELVDLGLHRLKDLGEPEKLFQLGAREFPPLRSLNATNLPAQPSRLVGRERELAELVTLVRDERLVTLTGAGGSGKTRLALQVAAELVESFPDGVFWAALAPVTDPELVLPTIASNLGAQGELADHVDERHMLLLLDNLEQVLGASPHLSGLLRACPNLHLLVTSRALLRIEGERDYAVEPLSAPEAVALFRTRAAVAEPEDAVREICLRVDCLPLAVELAAARTSVLPPVALLERLEHRLPVLTTGRRDAPERQRTLRATIAWSHELLSSEEQEVFRRLAVFAGSFDAPAAEGIAGAGLDTLQSLVDMSLVRRWASGRLGQLETVREFALEELEAAGEGEALRRRHAEFFLALAEGVAEERGAEPAQSDVLLAETDNARAALEWSLGSDPELGLRLAVALEGFWVLATPIEAMRWYDRLLERAPDAPLELRAHALRAYGGCANPAGEDELAEQVYAASLEAFRALGDDGASAVLLLRLGYSAFYRRDMSGARSLAEESLALFSATGQPKGESQSLGLLGEVEYAEGNHAAGLELMRRSAQLAGEVGFTWWRAGMLGKLVDCAFEQGELDEAAAHAREALALSRDLGDRLRVVRSLARLARVAAERGDGERAGRLWGALEAEESRGAVGAWESERERFAQPVFAHAGVPLERGLEQGRKLSLEEAVDEALRAG